jgi:2-amino-4-hydroxy-6-hydroxymethyldihydropteridine diphosphokinase
MPRIYVGVGSNLGRRVQNIRRCLQLLTKKGVRIVQLSPIYETEPKAIKPQAASTTTKLQTCGLRRATCSVPPAASGRKFLNLVVAADVTESPRACLKRLHEIEEQLGRPARHPQGAPRTIDLDLLLYGRQIIKSRQLCVPHPRMAARPFVLAPLADIAPNLIHPVLHRRIRTLARQVGRHGVRQWPIN